MIPRFNDGRDWFFEKRFGMFVHWGIYAVPAWHEQLQWRGGVHRDEYSKYKEQFNPVKFDPDAWLDLAQAAGMRYLTFTTKHHDGFCMWDTKCTDYNIMNTPYGKDVFGMLAEACQRRDVPLCIYYSLPDWYSPYYPNRGQAHELDGPLPGDEPDELKYVDFMKDQIRELCTKYGKIHGWWWDNKRLEYSDDDVNNLIRELQPGIMINNRGLSEGDFSTPERDYESGDAASRSYSSPVEACQSVGLESWGYRENENFYTDKYLMQSIDKMLAKGANYLLNIGPDAEGVIPECQARILRNIGKWFDKVQESIFDAEPCSEYTNNQDVLLTRKGNSLYVHFFQDPHTYNVDLGPISVAPKSATLLNDGRSLDFAMENLPRFFRNENNVLCLNHLPVEEFNDTVMIAKLEFDALPEPVDGTTEENKPWGL